MHTFKVNDYVEWTLGKTIRTGKIISVNYKTAIVVLTVFPAKQRIPLSKLRYLPPIELTSQECGQLVRLERDISSVVCGNVANNIVCTEKYTLTVEEFLVALQKIESSFDDKKLFNAWLAFIKIIFKNRFNDDDDKFYNENDVLNSMYDYLCLYGINRREKFLKSAIEEGKTFLRDVGKPISEREYPEYMKVRLLISMKTDAAMNVAAQERITLYRTFAEELAEKGDIDGLWAVGYGCYGGNRAFSCDWVRARDCIEKLFEVEESIDEKALAANALGYIYYYGWDNDGVGEYELAYKYLSFAAFNGIFEAKYKIADMYKNGYGVIQSSDTSDNIITELYNENLKHIRGGTLDSKFAQTACRMGIMYEEREEYNEALHYYLQAEFAFNMCRYDDDDVKAAKAVSAAIARVKNESNFNPNCNECHFSPEKILGDELTDGKKLDLVIKKQSELNYKMTFSPHQTPDGKPRKMFITFYPFEICGFFDKIDAIFSAKKPLDENLLGRVFVIDDMKFCDFFLDGKKVLALNGLGYPYFKRQKTKKKKYRFISVSFDGVNFYDYLCDDESIREGDNVTVEANGIKGGYTVQYVTQKTENELPLPLKRYKSVIEKCK